MAIQSRSLTYDDLERMRETRDERLELIDGELFVTPSPTPMHQIVSGRLQFLFKQKALELGFGLVFNAPLDVQLADDTIVQPDLIFVLPDRRPVVTAAGWKAHRASPLRFSRHRQERSTARPSVKSMLGTAFPSIGSSIRRHGQ